MWSFGDSYSVYLKCYYPSLKLALLAGPDEKLVRKWANMQQKQNNPVGYSGDFLQNKNTTDRGLIASACHIHKRIFIILQTL
jgi:hypothetical protein